MRRFEEGDFTPQAGRLWKIISKTGRSAETIGYIGSVLGCSWEEAGRIMRKWVIISESSARCMLRAEWRTITAPSAEQFASDMEKKLAQFPPDTDVLYENKPARVTANHRGSSDVLIRINDTGRFFTVHVDDLELAEPEEKPLIHEEDRLFRKADEVMSTGCSFLEKGAIGTVADHQRSRRENVVVDFGVLVGRRRVNPRHIERLQSVGDNKPLILFVDKPDPKPAPPNAIRNRWHQAVMNNEISGREHATPFTYASDRVDVLEAMLDLAAEEMFEKNGEIHYLRGLPDDRLAEINKLETRLEKSDNDVHLLAGSIAKIGAQRDALCQQVANLEKFSKKTLAHNHELLTRERGYCRTIYEANARNARLHKSRQALKKKLYAEVNRYGVILSKSRKDKNDEIRQLEQIIQEIQSKHDLAIAEMQDEIVELCNSGKLPGRPVDMRIALNTLNEKFNSEDRHAKELGEDQRETQDGEKKV